MLLVNHKQHATYEVMEYKKRTTQSREVIEELWLKLSHGVNIDPFTDPQFSLFEFQIDCDYQMVQIYYYFLLL